MDPDERTSDSLLRGTLRFAAPAEIDQPRDHRKKLDRAPHVTSGVLARLGGLGHSHAHALPGEHPSPWRWPLRLEGPALQNLLTVTPARCCLLDDVFSELETNGAQRRWDNPSQTAGQIHSLTTRAECPNWAVPRRPRVSPGRPWPRVRPRCERNATRPVDKKSLRSLTPLTDPSDSLCGGDCRLRTAGPVTCWAASRNQPNGPRSWAEGRFAPHARLPRCVKGHLRRLGSDKPAARWGRPSAANLEAALIESRENASSP